MGLLAFAALLFFLVKSSPLLGTLGFESANFYVVLLGPIFLFVASQNFADKKKGFNSILLRELVWLFLILGLLFTALFINGTILASCSTGAGIWPFLVVLFPAILLNLSIGCVAAYLIKSRALKLFLCVAGFLLYYSWIIFSWWQHGTFRVFSHASFLMSSDLIEGDALSISVIGFRMATLLLSLAIILFGIYFLNMPTKKMFSKAKRPATIIFAFALISAHFALSYLSERSAGKNRSDLLSDYSASVKSDGIKVLYDPEKTSRNHASKILNEAAYYQDKLLKMIGQKTDVTIWLHETEQEKFLYTGAKNVHFALPRHKEIHISGHETPHGVLGHELAHIYLGVFSNSWLGYPSANGVIPNLALTEGLATALTKELNIFGDLTLEEQAAGLYQAGIEIDFDKLFSANPIYFAMLNPRVSYVYAGAALSFLLSSYEGPALQEKIQNLVRSGSLDSLDIPRIINKLKEPIPEYALSFARNNFKTTSIITSDCKGQNQNLQKSLRFALINQDPAEAQTIIELLPKNTQFMALKDAINRLYQAQIYKDALPLVNKALELAKNDEIASLKQLQLIGLSASGNYFAALMLIKDMDLKRFSPGNRRYLIAMELFLSAFLANEEQTLSRLAINYFTFDGQPMDMIELSYELARSQNSMLASVARYLLARFQINEKHYQEALNSINIILADKSLPSELEKEARAMRIKSLIKLGQEQNARDAFANAKDLYPSDNLLISEGISRLTFNHMHGLK